MGVVAGSGRIERHGRRPPGVGDEAEEEGARGRRSRGDEDRAMSMWRRAEGTRGGDGIEQSYVGAGSVGARVRRVRWAGLGSGLRLGSLSLLKEKKKTEIKKEKKERLGEEVGHTDNFPGLTKMSLIQAK